VPDPLIDVLEWIFSVWLPGLIIAGGLRYTSIVKSDQTVRILSAAVSFLLAILLAAKMQHAFLYSETLKGLRDKTTSIWLYTPIAVGIICGIVATRFTDHLVKRLAMLSK